MDPEIKIAITRFTDEIKKDIFFFGTCGAVVALFSIWQSRLKILGLLENSNWANELFSDFMSFNAFGLIFFGYLILASLAAAFADLKRPQKKLEEMVNHMETRLAQIASSIVCFMMGLLSTTLIYSTLNLDSGGIKLIGLTIGFSFFISASFIMAFLFGRRTEPFNKWWVAAISIIFFIGILIWLLIQSKK